MKSADFFILVLYLAALGAIVWKFRRSSSAPSEFFLAGRSFGAFPVGLSVMVTTFSAVNYLALPGEVCGHGLYVLASLPVFFIAAWPVTRFWMPFFLKKRPVSVYAFLEERYDSRVRLLASALFLVWRIFWMGVALYASCKITSVLTGMSLGILVLLCGALAALYSAIGGMRAVVWTDVLQFIVLLGSILAGVILTWQSGNWGELAYSGALKPFVPADWSYLSFNPRIRISLWSALLGTFVAFLTRFGADQMVMQRYLSASSLSAARWGLWLNGIASTLALGLLVIFGLALHLFARRSGLAEGTPPVKIVALLLKSFPPGGAGLIGAGLLAATMSSIDSGLNSCSAAITMDFLPRFQGKKPSPGMLTVLLSLPILAAAAWVLPALNRNNTLFVILNKAVNTLGTPLLAIMLCALFLRKIRGASVFYGTIAGTVLTVFCSFAINGLALHGYAVLSLLLTMGSIGAAEMFFSLFKGQP